MASKGRYLKQKEKKSMGKGKKIALIIGALLLALIIGVVCWYNGMLNLITRPEPTEKDLTPEELEEILNYNPDAGKETRS